MANRLCEAQSLLQAIEGSEMRRKRLGCDPKEAYAKARKSLTRTDRAIKRISSILETDRSLDGSRCLEFLKLLACLHGARCLIKPIAKSFYGIALHNGDLDGLYDGEKWKGLYTVYVTSKEGNILFTAEGARELSKILGVSIRSATDKLSRAFPGRAGKGAKKIVYDGKLCDVYFVLDER